MKPLTLLLSICTALCACAGKSAPSTADTVDTPPMLYVKSMKALATDSTAPCRPTTLQCEHLRNPLGIDNPTPRLAWRLQDPRQGARQTAYRVVVGTDSAAVAQGKGNVWDSGRRSTPDMLLTYDGPALQPLTRYYWQVRVWDKDQVPSTSETASFETGLMQTHPWQGTWIDDGHDIHYRPAPYFRKTFRAPKPILRARAYIAAAGLYELHINGRRIGNHRLDPLYTRFDRRNLYVTYDVTPQLQPGDNTIGVLLGNGWYNHQSLAVWDFHRAPWRNRPAFLLNLRITYTDGTTETLATGPDWKTSSAGPLVYNSIYTGEHYDARLEQPGWDTPRFDDSSWHPATPRPAPSTLVTAQQAVPIRAVDTIPARTCHRLNDTTYVFDFGQNMSGVTHIRAGGTPGTTLRLKHGERLYPDGRVDLSNIDVYHRPTDNSDPFQTDILILSGQGQDQFTPHFNYKGFRYVEVTADRPIHLDRESLTAYFIHSDVPPTGHIDASDSLIPQLCRATNRAYLSNLMGYPTDCPQREKNGWTGDSHFAIETALYNYDGFTVYEKWMADHRDEQRPDGVLPDIIPTGGWGYGTDNGLDWTSSIALIPWHLYLFYGDSKPLADCYDHIKRYVDYAAAHCTDGLTSWGRGDWVPVKSRANKELTSSTYLYVDACILARAARLFGRTDDHARYTALAAKTREAINRKYLDPQTGTYADGVQTELSVPLYWGIVPDSLRRTVARNLARQVQEAGYHLDVGVLGAKAILSALSENGEAETAYRLATQTTYPSWGNWVVNGATTLLENWDLHATRDISDNHMMFGDIGGWFFKGLGGILPDPEQPGFKHIILRPNFPQGLERFEATHLSPYGEIRSQWERQGKHITYRVTVPPNSTATFYPPVQVKDRPPLPLEAGTYEWQLEYAE